MRTGLARSFLIISIHCLLTVRSAWAGQVPALDSKGPVASGQRYNSDAEGAEFHLPQGWNYAEQDDSILLGSDTEPGAIFVWASDAKTGSEIQGEMRKALANTGQFGALEGVQQAALAAGKATVAEAAGVDDEGTKMRARVMAIVGPSRTIFVGGLTTDEAAKFSNLRKRVDSVARSVKFQEAAPGGGGKSPVTGQWWSYSASAGYTGSGSERTMAFCPDGRFVEKGESYYSGNTGSVAGSGGNAGKWKVRGNAKEGSVTVTYGDGSTVEFDYVAKTPDDLKFNNRAYGRTQVTLCR